MTVGGRGSLSPHSAPLSVGYCIHSRGALLSSHLPSPLPVGGEQLSWNHWTGENLVWLAGHLVLGDPCQAPGLGGGGGRQPASLGVFGGRPVPREATASSKGDTRPPALGTSCGGAGVAKSGCRGWDLASRWLGPSLHSGLSCTKKERGLWERGQEPQHCFWAGPSLRSSDWGRGGPELFGGQSVPSPLPLRGSRALSEAITALAASTLPPCLPHAWAPSQLAAWLTPHPHPLPLTPFSLPLLAFLKRGLGRPWGGWRSG